MSKENIFIPNILIEFRPKLVLNTLDRTRKEIIINFISNSIYKTYRQKFKGSGISLMSVDRFKRYSFYKCFSFYRRPKIGSILIITEDKFVIFGKPHSDFPKIFIQPSFQFLNNRDIKSPSLKIEWSIHQEYTFGSDDYNEHQKEILLNLIIFDGNRLLEDVNYRNTLESKDFYKVNVDDFFNHID